MKTKTKSRSQLEEERAIAEQIARATEFSASIRLGPFDKRTERGLASYEAAVAVADEMNSESRFGRRAIVYAINKLGSFDCTPELIAMAREINPAL